MKKKGWKFLTILLAAVTAMGTAVTVQRTLDYQKGARDYSEAEILAGIFRDEADAADAEDVLENAEKDAGANDSGREIYADPYAMLLSDVNLDELRIINSDVVGWIAIPDTRISYPLLKSEDNSYYLNHTWKKDRSAVGGIFLECQVDPDLKDFNTIIYGHKMRDNSMFGNLKYYNNTDYYKEHPSVYLVNDQGVFRYDIYAAYEVGLQAITYGLDIASEEAKEEFIRYGLEHSVIHTGILPETGERMVTLSTCTGRGHSTRWVVQAVGRNTPPPQYK